MYFNLQKEIILENDRVLLRSMQPADLENLIEVGSQDPKLVQYSPYQIHNRQGLAQFIHQAQKDRFIGKSRYAFIVFDKLKNQYAGSTSFLNISNHNSCLEIGATWIGKDFQRTGLNRNCKHLLLSYAFDQLQAERVEFKTDERNEQSRTAILQLGAKFEGILRSNTLMLDGFRRSTVYYSILKEEWIGNE
jgi:N-acetyltransferase